MRLLLCAVAAFGPALAQADTLVAICETGGCICSASPLSTEEIMFIAGDTLMSDIPGDPDRETLVYEPDRGILSWVDARGADIHRSFGGAGDCPVDARGDAASITPLDGIWKWRTLGESTSGCPAILGAMLATSGVEFIQTRVLWDGEFDPALLSDSFPQPELSGITPYKWQKRGPDRWLSDNVQGRVCHDGSCTETAVTVSATLVSDDRISGLLSLHSRVDGAQAAIMAGFGMADCRVQVRYDILRIGP